MRKYSVVAKMPTFQDLIELWVLLEVETIIAYSVYFLVDNISKFGLITTNLELFFPKQTREVGLSTLNTL